MKSKVIVANKGNEIFIILVKENMECHFNFGTNDFFSLEDFKNLKKHPNRKLKHYAESPKYKKDLKETLDVVNNSKDYIEMCERFKKDFKSDRSYRIKEYDMELDKDATGIDLTNL